MYFMEIWLIAVRVHGCGLLHGTRVEDNLSIFGGETCAEYQLHLIYYFFDASHNLIYCNKCDKCLFSEIYHFINCSAP